MFLLVFLQLVSVCSFIHLFILSLVHITHIICSFTAQSIWNTHVLAHKKDFLFLSQFSITHWGCGIHQGKRFSWLYSLDGVKMYLSNLHRANDPSYTSVKVSNKEENILHYNLGFSIWKFRLWSLYFYISLWSFMLEDG